MDNNAGGTGIGRGAEGIRAWYERSTRKARMALIGATCITAIGMFVFWFAVPPQWAARLQTANGGYTIPAFGGLWIASFMFIWLIPMRELSFRGQESMERMEERLQHTLEQKLVPSLETWQRIGERVEHSLIPKAEKAVEQLVKSAKFLEDKIGPAMEGARRIEMKLDGYISQGLVEELTEAARSLRAFTSPQGPPLDTGRTVAMLNAPRNGVGAVFVPRKTS